MNIGERYRAWRAEGQARKKYEEWVVGHPNEARLLEVVPKEIINRHRSSLNPRWAQYFEQAQSARRELGLRDEFVDLVLGFPHALERFIHEHEGQNFSLAEITLAREVNRGYLLSTGATTPNYAGHTIKLGK